MPHERRRYISVAIEKGLKHSSIVGLFGQRQTGKTTVVLQCARDYVTFDRVSDLTSSENDPEQFLENRTSPFGVDECQLSPRLFPALKEFVRIHPAKGQFLLTGSVRFTSRRAIRESLTGRIYLLELLPFNIAEAHGLPLGDALVRATLGRFPSRARLERRHFERFLESGGLPGICFSRDAHIRNSRFESQLDTLLQRDIRLVYETRLDYRTLRNVLVVLALTQGLPFDLSEASRKTRLNRRTLKDLLTHFESMFLIRRIETEGGTRRPTYFLEDQGMATYLAGKPLSPHENLVRGLYANVRHEFHYRPELNPTLFQYRTRGGADIPLAWHTKNGTLGLIPCIEHTPTASAVKSAQSFLRSYSDSRVLILTNGNEYRKISDRLFSAPLESVL